MLCKQLPWNCLLSPLDSLSSPIFSHLNSPCNRAAFPPSGTFSASAAVRPVAAIRLAEGPSSAFLADAAGAEVSAAVLRKQCAIQNCMWLILDAVQEYTCSNIYIYGFLTVKAFRLLSTGRFFSTESLASCSKGLRTPFHGWMMNDEWWMILYIYI